MFIYFNNSLKLHLFHFLQSFFFMALRWRRYILHEVCGSPNIYLQFQIQYLLQWIQTCPSNGRVSYSFLVRSRNTVEWKVKAQSEDTELENQKRNFTLFDSLALATYGTLCTNIIHSCPPYLFIFSHQHQRLPYKRHKHFC